MDDEDKKAIKILVTVPGISILIGLILMFVFKEFQYSLFFLLLGIFSYSFELIIYFSVKSSEGKINKIKKQNMYVIADIEHIIEEDKELDVTVSAVVNNHKYTFISCYKVKKESLDVEINNKLEELNIKTIRVWVDLKDYNNFELDIEDLFKTINLKEKVESIYWEATKE